MLNRIVIMFVFFVSMSAYAQKLTYKFVDSITYVQLANQQYEDLIDTAESALYEDIDFYYLRLRLGIAYYSLTNYEHALPNFIKANEMNPADTLCQEYLYYSYLFSGRSDDASILAASYSPAMQKKLNYKNKVIEAVTISSGYGFTNNMEEGKTKEISGNKYIYGQALYQGPFLYSCALVQHKIKNRLRLMYGGWYYHTQSMGAVQADKQFITETYTHSHYQYTGALSYYFKNKIDVSLAGAYYIQNASLLYGVKNPITPNYDFFTYADRINSYAFVAGIGRRFGKVYPVINIAKSNFSERDQFQAEASVLFYPFNNNNLYTYTAVCYKNDDEENKFIFFQKLGAKIWKNLWVEENFSSGNHYNYVSKYAFLTYNTLEPITIILGLDFKYYFKHLELTAGYRLQQLQGEFFYYDAPDKIINRKYNYINNLISNTLKWNF